MRLVRQERPNRSPFKVAEFMPQIVIDSLAGLFAQFKSDSPSGLLLPDSCAIRCVSAGSDILDP
jgi:hypothetical protein